MVIYCDDCSNGSVKIASNDGADNDDGDGACDAGNRSR